MSEKIGKIIRAEDGFLALKMVRPAEKVETFKQPVKPEGTAISGEETSFDNFKVDELKQIAEENNIELPSKSTKAEIIALLIAAGVVIQEE